jgi:hypothetical protein
MDRSRQPPVGVRDGVVVAVPWDSQKSECLDGSNVHRAPPPNSSQEIFVFSLEILSR